jgi:hypothetical protein
MDPDQDSDPALDLQEANKKNNFKNAFLPLTF